MKKLILSFCAIIAINVTMAQQIIKLDVWGDKTPPHTVKLKDPQGVTNQGHITNCQTAQVELYIPKGGADKTVVVCPGGGYGVLAIEHEGRQFAQFLMDNGIAAAVLSYRMPGGVPQIPLEDTEQVFKILKKGGSKLGIKPSSIGIMGFSAGGHLASTASVRLNPSFSILFYPVISSDQDVIHNGSFNNLTGGNKKLYDYYSAEKHITAKTPPALLFHSLDDSAVPIENSKRYRDALLAKNIPAELITYPTGGHGWGFNSNMESHEAMKAKLLEWIKAL